MHAKMHQIFHGFERLSGNMSAAFERSCACHQRWCSCSLNNFFIFIIMIHHFMSINNIIIFNNNTATSNTNSVTTITIIIMNIITIILPHHHLHHYHLPRQSMCERAILCLYDLPDLL